MLGSRTLTDLIHRHRGRPAVVMGGAPSLVQDMLAVPLDAIRLSANDHGAKLERVDYIVCSDNIEPRLRPFGCPIVGPRHWCDYRVLGFHPSNSGALAVLVAWVLGCAPILVAGVSLYQGPTYWHDPKAKSTGQQITLEMHLRRWTKLKQMPAGYVVRPMSGPLLSLFPPYDPREIVVNQSSAEAVRELVAGVVVEFTKPTSWKGRQFGKGDRIEVKHVEAGELISQHSARRAQTLGVLHGLG